MSDRPVGLADDQVLAAFGSHTVRAAADLREQIARNRATEHALRDYLRRRGAPAGPERPVIVTEPSVACVRDARAYARRCCAEQDVQDDRRDVLELAVSELVGNAVRYGRPPISYEIIRDGDDLVLVVGDGNPHPPGDGTDRGLDCEGGRGLLLISRMARCWGWEPAGAGKRVWVRV